MFKNKYANLTPIQIKKKKAMSMIKNSFALIAFGLVLIIAAFLSGLNSSPIKEEEFGVAVGEVEYYRELKRNKTQVHAIGIKDNNIEYVLPANLTKYLTNNFEEEIMNKKIYLSYDKNQNLENLDYNGRTNWLYINLIKTDDKIYVSYDNYVQTFNSNKKISTVIFIIGIATLSFSVGLVAFLIYRYNKIKDDEIKQESSINGE